VYHQVRMNNGIYHCGSGIRQQVLLLDQQYSVVDFSSWKYYEATGYESSTGVAARCRSSLRADAPLEPVS
jgi:hypothetical protein